MKQNELMKHGITNYGQGYIYIDVGTGSGCIPISVSQKPYPNKTCNNNRY
jgi:methylase of polypeptide subunit release factors